MKFGRSTFLVTSLHEGTGSLNQGSFEGGCLVERKLRLGLRDGGLQRIREDMKTYIHCASTYFGRFRRPN